jgi:hypothetical protein
MMEPAAAARQVANEHRANVHAGLLQDRRIDEHDVGHGEEGREPSTELGRDARAGGG